MISQHIIIFAYVRAIQIAIPKMFIAPAKWLPARIHQPPKHLTGCLTDKLHSNTAERAPSTKPSSSKEPQTSRSTMSCPSPLPQCQQQVLRFPPILTSHLHSDIRGGTTPELLFLLQLKDQNAWNWIIFFFKWAAAWFLCWLLISSAVLWWCEGFQVTVPTVPCRRQHPNCPTSHPPALLRCSCPNKQLSLCTLKASHVELPNLTVCTNLAASSRLDSQASWIEPVTNWRKL